MNEDKIAALPCWGSSVTLEPLSGGITNLNYKVSDGKKQYVVRLGEDVPHHLISRANEIATGIAAHRIGTSPEVIYHEPGVLVIEFIEGTVLGPANVREPDRLQRILKTIKAFHQDMPTELNGYPILFWVFQVLRHYNQVLRRENSAHINVLPELMNLAERLEKCVGPIQLVYGHNDLLAGNFIDDGDKVWLIDFDYAGFNSPLFDLSNLASNNELTDSQETELLGNYYERDLREQEMLGYKAMKCASLLRETMWSMVSEIYSELDFDYAQYTTENLDSFYKSLDECGFN